MYKYVIKRLLALIPVILGVIFIIYLILDMTPGDAVTTILGTNYTPEAAEALREQLGLNRPFIIKFISYVLGICHGDFGRSYITNVPVLESIGAAFPNTVILVIVSMSLEILRKRRLSLSLSSKSPALAMRLARPRFPIANLA